MLDEADLHLLRVELHLLDSEAAHCNERRKVAPRTALRPSDRAVSLSVVATRRTASMHVRGILDVGNDRALMASRCGIRRCRILFPPRFDRYKVGRRIVS
jgi:hypothetical protein